MRIQAVYLRKRRVYIHLRGIHKFGGPEGLVVKDSSQARGITIKFERIWLIVFKENRKQYCRRVKLHKI